MQRKITLRNRLNFALESLAARSGDYSFPSGTSGVVVSPGGVASTMLISYTRKFLKVNDVGNIDGLKHRPTPPKKRIQEIPVVLITGNFEQIAASLQHRDYLPHQAIRLGSPVFFLVPAKLRARIFKSAVDRQRKLWERDYTNLLVVDYEEIWDRKEEIARHFGIQDPAFTDLFPARQTRNST
jgi:hypothetical protein